MSESELNGQTAIVTGGAGKTGTAISVALARRGADIVIAQRSADSADPVIDRIEEFGSEAAYIETDLGIDDEIVALVKATNERFGGPNIIVNNAINPNKDHAKSIPRNVIDQNISVNLIAPFRLAQEAYPHMIDEGFGRIINVGAIQAHSPFKGSVTYAMAKAGLEGMVRSLAVEWSDTKDADITANTLHVGAYKTQTDESASLPIEERYNQTPSEKDENALTLVGRWGRPSDLADVVVFLASSKSAFITGQTINCDGGRLISRKPALQSHL